jgi:small subunit ribosomal protein S1
MVLIDIGAKTVGVVSGEDLTEAYDVLKELKVGEAVSAYVKFPENDQGQIILSLKQAADENRWSKFKKMLDEEKELEVTGLEVNKGGMVVKVGDIRGFVPTSQFGEKFLGNMDDL